MWGRPLDLFARYTLGGFRLRAPRPVVVFACLGSLAIVSMGCSPERLEPGTQRFVGSWESFAGPGELEAHFVPIEPGAWDVSFYFKWDGKRHHFKGRATGQLASGGDLEGEVQNPDATRTWQFSGTFDPSGVFQGSHGELDDGERVPSGFLTLTPAGG